MLKTMNPDAAKKLRATQVKNVYREAVMDLWPEPAALFILRSTNSCFIDRQKIVDPQGNLRTNVVFGLYLSDSTARTELDNRTPHLLMKMKERGVSADQVQLLSAKMNMRKRKLFPELDEQPANARVESTAGKRATTEGEDTAKPIEQIMLETAEASAIIENEGIAKRFTQAMMVSMGADSAEERTTAISESADRALESTTAITSSSMTQSQQLELFKKALILTIEEVDQCAAVLDHIGGASIQPLDGERKRGNAQTCTDDERTKDARYRVGLHVRELDAMQKILSYFDSKLIKNCWKQGLKVVRIEMYAASPFLEQQHAFPAQGDPIPLQHYYAQGINPLD